MSELNDAYAEIQPRQQGVKRQRSKLRRAGSCFRDATEPTLSGISGSRATSSAHDK